MTAIEQTTPAAPDTTIDETSAEYDLRALVTVSREHAADAQQRQVLVRIDENPSSTLLYGDRITVEVTPGAHLFRANNTLFWKRVPFTIEAGEHLEFIVVNRAGRLSLGFLAVMGVAPMYLDIERRSVQ